MPKTEKKKKNPQQKGNKVIIAYKKLHAQALRKPTHTKKKTKKTMYNTKWLDKKIYTLK